MTWPKAHTVWRLIVSIVVCACAIGTYWNRTHPPSPIKQKIVQVTQGDGYMNEDQCRSIKRGMKMSSIREKFGAPAELPDDEYEGWIFSLRNDHARHCVIYHSDWYGPIRKGERVDSVTLELVSGE